MDQQLIRFHSEFLALESLVVAITKALQRSSPAFAASLREVGSQKIEEYRRIAMPHLPPEQADLYSAEIQEAFERLIQMALLKPGD